MAKAKSISELRQAVQQQMAERQQKATEEIQAILQKYGCDIVSRVEYMGNRVTHGIVIVCVSEEVPDGSD